jgi:ElaB/YqjD/DUF883 family membrane-anchored ribosome-binding protein
MNAVVMPLNELFDGVDDLIKRVADTENPEIRKSRAKVHASMRVARSAYADDAAPSRRHADFLDDCGGEILGPSPVEALGVALLVGVGLGVIMSMQQ